MPSPPVLVVDDDPIIVRLITLALRSAGYEVASAADGEEGLEQVRELNPALVLTDADMPRLSGYDLCRKLRADPEVIPQPHVVMLTAAGQDADREQAEQAGVDEFMTKPFSPSQLIVRVRDVLGTRS